MNRSSILFSALLLLVSTFALADAQPSKPALLGLGRPDRRGASPSRDVIALLHVQRSTSIGWAR